MRILGFDTLHRLYERGFGRPHGRRPGRRSGATSRDRAVAEPDHGSRLVVAFTVAALLFGGLAGAAWYAQHRAQQRDNAARDSLAAATTAAQAIFSYDYHTFDASVANGRSFVTGPFATEYTQTTSSLKDTATKEQAVVRAQVSAAGVIDATPDRVELLLYINQYRRNINIAGEKVDQNRVTLTMVRVGHDWRVSGASAI
jgi:Mce-associated membrane protein